MRRDPGSRVPQSGESSDKVTRSQSNKAGRVVQRRARCGLGASAILALACVCGCASTGGPGVRVSVGGAQIAAELVDSWLRSSAQPRFAVDLAAPIYLSQHGFENLARGDCELACTDRRPSAREIEAFGDQRIAGRRVAFYGYGLYVNRRNPLDSIFSRHLRLVFQQRIKDWSELAGEQLPDWRGPIRLLGPPKGTRAGQILGPIAKIWFADARWEELPTDQAVAQAVADDPLALGFASIGYDQRARYLGLRMDRFDAPAFPSIEAIEREQYGLARIIYVYYRDPPSPAVHAALRFLDSPAGGLAIESTGMWPIDSARAAVTAGS